ncbi:MAG: peptide ABC transporter substrate-binding protein, partial [Candidatus Cybelea sp.]
MSDPDHLNPYLSEMGVTADLSSLVYSFLVIADSRGHPIGDLASSVPSLANGGISRDGRTYVYHLRRNILWQDGVPFTARDIVASWQAVMNPHHNTFVLEGYDRVASIESPGSTTVVVHLRERYPPFVSHFFSQEDGKPVLPAHILARSDFNTGELSTHPVGTGPFRFVSWVRGDRIVLARFDRYFKGSPKLSRIEMHFIPNAQTIAVQLQGHLIDLIAVPQASLLGQYRSIGGVSVGTGPLGLGQTRLDINTSKPGLDDVAVRRALAIAVPYDTIMHDVEPLAVQARNVLPPTVLGYEALARRTYDPAAARNILDRAGWRRGADGVRTRNGIRLAFTVITVEGFTSFGRIVLLLQSALRPVGIELAIKTYSYRTTFAPTGPLYGGSFDLALNGWSLNS